MASNIDTQLSAAIDQNWTRQVDWLKSLVSFPSLRGEEAPCQDWIAREFAQRGWAVDRYTLADVAMETLPGFSPVMDTDYSQRRAGGGEPARAEARGPLADHAGPCRRGADRPGRHVADRRRSSPTIEDGRMYGRGANDMKSGVCAMVFALDALRDAGYLPGSDVYVQTVTEEESTGNGALSTLARGYRADACLIPEPTGARDPARHDRRDVVPAALRGKPVHVSESERGTNAILSAFGLIEALRGHTRELNERVKSDPWFSRIPNPIKFNPGKIAGGDWACSTPAWCEVDCRIAVLPGMSLAAFREELTRRRDGGGAAGSVPRRESARDRSGTASRPTTTCWSPARTSRTPCAPRTAACTMARSRAKSFLPPSPTAASMAATTASRASATARPAAATTASTSRSTSRASSKVTLTHRELHRRLVRHASGGLIGYRPSPLSR